MVIGGEDRTGFGAGRASLYPHSMSVPDNFPSLLSHNDANSVPLGCAGVRCIHNFAVLAQSTSRGEVCDRNDPEHASKKWRGMVAYSFVAYASKAVAAVWNTPSVLNYPARAHRSAASTPREAPAARMRHKDRRCRPAGRSAVLSASSVCTSSPLGNVSGSGSTR
jgi:hypothetical protein